jgi:ribosomal protein L11 methylase PrmA
MSAPLIDLGSFRDPNGRVFRAGDEIFRTVSPRARGDYDFVQSTGLIDRLIGQGRLVATAEVGRIALPGPGASAYKVLRHARIPFVSYPYEWPFPLLKSAALLHLSVQIEALRLGVSLSDASAYNVQFNGIQPIFIDALSFKRYREGETWSGHRQFCEQFLNPLLLRAYLGIPHNAWFRGSLEGIDTAALDAMLPFWRKLSLNVFSHVVLPARALRHIANGDEDIMRRAKAVTVPRQRYLAMLQQLRDWISTLEPRDTGRTIWQSYETTNTYANTEANAKHDFIAEFASKVRPGTLWDMGCNSGAYAQTALAAGATRVIGFDADQGALEHAYVRAKAKSLDLLLLYQDGANPSPNQGWASEERLSVTGRGGADAVIALAFEHHLAIARNVPLDRVVGWLAGLAPAGVIEWVEKTDPTVQHLLALREDIFDGYTKPAFEAALSANARLVKSEIVSSAGRTLYWFDRS